MRTGSLLAALAISVAINLWQWRASPAAGEGSPSTDKVVASPMTASAATTASRASERPCTPGTTSSQQQAARDAELTRLQARLTVLEQEHRDHLPSDKRFEQGAEDVSSKQRIEAQLQRLFGADGGSNPWTVECRDQICKVDVIAETQELAQAQLTLLHHDPALRALVAGYASFGSTPTQDVVTGKPEVEVPNYLTVRSEADAKAMAALLAIADQFKASGGMRECTHGYAEKGTLKAVLDLVPGSPLSVTLEGAGLSQTAAGTCVRERLLALASAAGLPAPENETTDWLYLESPPSAP